jgi:MFS transporter, PAT family, beta-lactamase induction signal transducer AmpG
LPIVSLSIPEGELVNLTLSDNRTLRLTTLCVLYVSQGLPDGFVRTGLKTYLIANGATLAEVSHVITLLSWPWAIKWVWGPVIDRFSYSSLGRRRPWILGAQFFMGMSLASMLFIPNLPDNIRLLGMTVLLINCFSSLQDVAVDALAIDLLPESERGITNGFMFASFYVGSFLGGAVIGRLLLKQGIQAAVTCEIMILVVIAMFPLMFRERRGDGFVLPRRRTSSDHLSAERRASIRHTLVLLKQSFSRRASILAGMLAGCALVATSAHLVFWSVYVQRELKWTSDAYLLMEGSYAMAFGLVGALLGGIAASWLGARWAVVLSLLGLAMCWFLHAATANMWDNTILVTSLFLAVAFLASFFQVSLFALFMGVCSTSVAATQFSAYMALLNVSGSVGSKLAGSIGTKSQLIFAFAMLGCFQLAMIALVAFMNGGSKSEVVAPPKV